MMAPIYMINDNSTEAVEYRKKLIEDKKSDILTRLNEDLQNGPFVGLMNVVKYTVKRNSFTGYWDVTFFCQDNRQFTVSSERFFHVFHQKKQRKYRLNNRIKAYLGMLAWMMRKYAVEINEFYKSHSAL